MSEKVVTTCSHVTACELFPSLSSGFLRVWQVNYCHDDFKKCARYALAAAGEKVPATMLPNGQQVKGSKA